MKRTKLYWEILDKKRTTVLPNLKFLKDAGFYLAGGTALALQIKHRVSVDFDFYNQREFDSEALLEDFQETSNKIILIQKAKDTLIVKIRGIEASLFTYRYRLIKPTIETKFLYLASLEDIAAMKLITIIQRGIKRDFIDFYFLIKRFGLKKIFQMTQKKYPPFNKYLGLQAIAYFDDADKSVSAEITMLEPVNWQDIKDFIAAKAKEFKDSLKK